ncbi:methylglutaconyl-CoA hydratase [Ekhidna lutea]|uniref:Methylglutaconyl-CoA hydratase n=1 Tax=Ekhidna lutea TaxID=447679 RepID=A0A239KKP9_EKHLU|nr:enoyl-CoA hydratase/isomerase family protein [Ekhidna lutea]SNT18946.1 methylglutaconyl-CoA hydratase [Ekhidna lutea]
MSNYVKLDINNGIGTVEFFTEQSNSLPGDILKKLADTITEAGNDPEIKVIILKSGGNRTFCAGASFDELMAVDSPENGKKFFMGFANVINAMRKCPKFIIGRLQGKAVGGGIGLAASVDYCFASKHSAIKLSELALGIGPFVVGPAIERKVGLSAMSQMAMNPDEFYDPKWAHQKGLFGKLYDDAAALDKAVNQLAEKLAAYNPEAMAELKKVFWEGTEHWDELLAQRAEMSGKLVLSEFTRNFIQKFKDK